MKKLIFAVVVCAAGCTKTNNQVKDVGTACTKNDDCQSKLCLPLANGRNVCTAYCTAGSCLAGWSCTPLGGGTAVCSCTPGNERCDGLDNDCNGIIDDSCNSMPDLAGLDLSFIGSPPPDLAGADLSSTDLASSDLSAVIDPSKVDILLVVDDSPSMTPIQTELAAAFPTFAAELATFPSKGYPTSFHIGVVTTDLGAGSTGAPGCTTTGLGAKLQPLGRAAPVGCLAPVGANFIELDQSLGTNNLPAGQDLPKTLTCMTAVGSNGCGFEMPLEAGYKALHDAIPENVGFLRPDALLAVVWITNEDDCSAPPTTDLFDKTITSYGAEASYRCTNYGIMCGNPPQLMPYGDSGGPLSLCQSATTAVGGKLLELGRYVGFFNQAGGVKTDPRAVVLAAIDAPAMPVASTLYSTGTTTPCSPISSTCQVTLVHSCVLATNTAINGDPAVRISQLLHGNSHFVESSVCQSDYSPTLTSIADAILSARMGL